MYVIYGQKTKGKEGPFPLNEQISFLSDVFDNRCWIFAVLGYMSKGENAGKYIEGFTALISEYSNNKQYIGFGNGYSASGNRNRYTEAIKQGEEILKLCKNDGTYSQKH
mgnify:CR=1 FL=1